MTRLVKLPLHIKIYVDPDIKFLENKVPTFVVTLAVIILATFFIN